MKQKLAVMAIVTAMVCLSLASVSPSAGAGDVGGSVVREIISSPVGIIIEDVAWSDDGSIALGVGYDSSGNSINAAWYYPETNLWVTVTTTPYGALHTLNAVEYCSYDGNFYLVGESYGGVTAFYASPGVNVITGLGSGASPTQTLNDLSIDIWGNTMVVGANDYVRYLLRNTVIWYTVSDADTTGYDYYGVDYESYYKRFYMVGENSGGGGSVIAFTDPIATMTTVPTNHYDYLPAEWGNYPELTSIAWNNNPDFPIADKYGLVGGNNVLVGIQPIDLGGEFFAGTSYPAGNYNYITWDESTWDEATLINYVGTTSYLYQFINSTKNIVLLDIVTQPDTFNAVDYKPPASPSWGFVVGATGGYQLSTNAFHSDTTITISSDMPHIFSMDMWKASDGIGGASKLDKQIDVNEVYTFAIEVNYTVGGVSQLFDGIDDVRIVLEAFYDEESASSFAEPTWATPDNRTRQFQFLWEEGVAGDSVNMLYPIGSPGTNEFQLVNGWRDPTGYDADGFTYKLYFNISFGPQMRAADGNGFANGAAPNPYDEVSAFNDLDSWNFGMMIFDLDFPTAANASYGEFGVFQYSNITVSGSPSGNAPPGTINQVLGNPSQITATSNIPYYVNVSVPDLARVGGGGSISATDVKVRSTSTMVADTNSMISNMMPFPGANVNLSVWGNTSMAQLFWVVPAPKNGTTAHGPWGSDFNGYATTDLLWYVTIPGATAEGIYQATITFRIGNYS